MLSSSSLEFLEHMIGDVNITQHSTVSGGDINKAYKLQTNKGDYFVKSNDALRYPGMLEAEAKGLELLAKKTEFTIPKVVAVGEYNKDSCLILHFLQKRSEKSDFWIDFGQKLAKMHRKTQKSFGLDHDNYIGSLRQTNHKHSSWVEFYIQERLEPQLKMAMDAKEITSAKSFEKLFVLLGDIYPNEPPALLHGDLWGGNYMVDSAGEPTLIDPAVYYGHREMDIAMTKLFGGFNNEMYHSYNDHLPLEKGWENRLDISQLYPLLVHVNLFGGSYVNSVMRIVDRYI